MRFKKSSNIFPANYRLQGLVKDDFLFRRQHGLIQLNTQLIISDLREGTDRLPTFLGYGFSTAGGPLFNQRLWE